jgi:hypothetical protein
MDLIDDFAVYRVAMPLRKAKSAFEKIYFSPFLSQGWRKE